MDVENNVEIPDDAVILSHDDYVFKGYNSGHYTWCIDKQLVDSILSGQCRHRIQSERFSMANLFWRLEMRYVKTEDNKDHLRLQLKMDEEILRPAEVKSISVSSILMCDQTLMGKCQTQSWPYWSSNTRDFECLFNHLNSWQQQNFDRLSFTASIFIPYIESNCFQGELSRSISSFKFKWNLQCGILRTMFCAYYQYMLSPILDNMWQIEFYPGTSGAKRFSLKLIHHPPSIKSIRFRFTLSCVESGAVKTAETRFQIRSDSINYGKRNCCELELLKESDYSDHDSLTLLIDLEILKVKGYDDDDADEMPKHTSDPVEIANIISALKRDEKPLSLEEAKIRLSSNTTLNIDTEIKQIGSNTNDLKSLQNVVEKQQETIESLSNMMGTLQSKVELLTTQIASIQSVLSDEHKVEGVDDLKERMDVLDLNMKRLMEKKKENEHGDAAVMEVQRWLKMVNLEQYLDLFIRNGFDQLSVIQTLTMNDLLEIGIEKKGHRIRIVQAIAIMKATGTTSQSQTAKPSEPGTAWSWNSELF